VNVVLGTHVQQRYQVFSWVGKDPDGNLRIKNHVISSNHYGGTAKESADGVLLAKELCYFDDPGGTVGKIPGISDNGGGGAIQNTQPLMGQNGASVTGNCLLQKTNHSNGHVFGYLMGMGSGSDHSGGCCTFGDNS